MGRNWLIMKKPAECYYLNDIRSEIDRIDFEIKRLIGERAFYVMRAAKYKKEGKAIKAKDRVKSMLKQRIMWAEKNNLDPDMIEKLFSKIIHHFIAKKMVEWENIIK
jgi:isochorismate pyruvate lyase